MGAKPGTFSDPQLRRRVELIAFVSGVALAMIAMFTLYGGCSTLLDAFDKEVGLHSEWMKEFASIIILLVASDIYLVVCSFRMMCDDGRVERWLRVAHVQLAFHGLLVPYLVLLLARAGDAQGAVVAALAWFVCFPGGIHFRSIVNKFYEQEGLAHFCGETAEEKSHACEGGSTGAPCQECPPIRV